MYYFGLIGGKNCCFSRLHVRRQNWQLWCKYANLYSLQQSTVKVYPSETIVLLNKSLHQHRAPGVVYSMPFQNFNEVSVKSKVSGLLNPPYLRLHLCFVAVC